MGRGTQCNYCTLRGVRLRAKEQHQVVTIIEKPMERFIKGVDVYVHPIGESLHQKYWRMWFAELTDHCVC